MTQTVVDMAPVDGVVSALIGIGEWGDGTSPDDRAASAAQIRVVSGEFQVMLVDGPGSIWSSHGLPSLRSCALLRAHRTD